MWANARAQCKYKYYIGGNVYLSRGNGRIGQYYSETVLAWDKPRGVRARFQQMFIVDATNPFQRGSGMAALRESMY